MELCLATDDNYAKYCATVIISAIENKNAEDTLRFHIIHGGLSEASIQKLQSLEGVILHKVDDELFLPYLRKAKCSWPTPTLYRLKGASIFNFDKIIYLDCDVIIRSSLKKLWNEDIENYYAGAVGDITQSAHLTRLKIEENENNFYFNAGVMVFNLKKIREDRLEEKMFNYLSKNFQELVFNDQDVLNYTMQGTVKRLDEKFNFIPYTGYQNKNKHEKNYIKDVVVAHHAGIKPWEPSFNNILRDEFWHYFKLCPFLNKAEFNKMYKKYKNRQSKLRQVLLFLKYRPFALFSKKRRDPLFEIIFD